MTEEPTILDVFAALAQTRQGRKTLTFAIRYGPDPEAAQRAWEWVDDPTKPL